MPRLGHTSRPKPRKGQASIDVELALTPACYVTQITFFSLPGLYFSLCITKDRPELQGLGSNMGDLEIWQPENGPTVWG